jgi:phage-related protein/predicted  nucleic acid-binding Zn-ribbon protein
VTTLARVAVEFEGDTSGVNAALSRMQSQLDNLHKSVGSGASQASQQASQAFAGMGQAAEGAAGAVRRVAEAAAGYAIGIAAVTGLKSAFDAAKDGVLGFNASMEQSQAAYKTLLRDGEAATLMLAQLQKEAAATPFEFKDLDKSARMLLAFNINASNLIPLLKDIGQAAAAGGDEIQVKLQVISRAIGQINQAGRLMGQDALQLIQAGINPYEIMAEHMNRLAGETKHTAGEMKALGEAGKISSKDFIEAFQNYSRAKFGTAFEDQAKTFNGAMSTIRDNLSQFAGTAFNPIFQVISQAAQSLAKFVSDDSFLQWAARISAGVQVAIDGIAALGGAFSTTLNAVLDIVLSVGGLIYEALQLLNPWVPHSPPLVQQVVTGVDAIMRAYGDMGAAEDSIGTVANALKRFALETANLVNTLDPIPEKLKAILDKSPQIAMAYAQLDKAITDAKGTLTGMKSEIDTQKEVLDNYKGELETAKEGLKPFQDALKNAEEALKAQAEAVTSAKEALAPWEEALKAEQEVLNEIASQIRDAEYALTPFKDAIKAAEEGLRAKADAIKAAQEGLEPYKDAIEAAKKALEDKVKALEPLKDQLEQVSEKYRIHADQLKEYETQVRDAEAAIQGFSRTPVAGTAEMKKKIDDANSAVKESEDKLKAIKKSSAYTSIGNQIEAAKKRLEELNNMTVGWTGALTQAEKAKAVAEQRKQVEDLTKKQEALLDPVKAEIEQRKERLAALQREKELTIDAAQARVDAIAKEALGYKELTEGQLVEYIKKQKEIRDAAIGRAQEEKAVVDSIAKQRDDIINKIKDQNKAIDEAKKKVEEETQRYKDQAKAVEDLKKAYEAQQKVVDAAKKAYEEAAKPLEQLKKAYSEQQRAVDEAKKALEEHMGPLKDAQKAYEDKKKAVDEAKQALEDASKPVDKLNEKVKKQSEVVQGVTKDYQDASGRLRELEGQMNKLTQAAEKAQAIADKKGAEAGPPGQLDLGDTKKRLEEQKKAYEETKKSIEGGVAPALARIRQVADDAALGVKNFSDWIRTGTDVLRGYLPMVQELINQYGGVKGILEQMLPVLVGIAEGFAAFKIMGLLLPVVTALTGGLGTLWGVITGATSIGTVLGGVVAAVSGVGVILAIAAIAIGVFAAAWTGNWGGIQEKTQVVVDWLMNDLPALLQGAWTSAQQVFGIAIGGILLLLEGLQTGAAGAWQYVIDSLTSIWGGLVETVSGIWGGLLETVSGIWNGIGNVIMTVVNTVVGTVTSIWNGLIQTIVIIMQGIYDGIMFVWNQIPLDIQQDLTLIYDTVTQRWNAAVETVKSYLAAFIEFHNSFWTGLFTAAQTGVQTVFDIITTIWNTITTTISTAVTGWVTLLGDTWTTIVSAATVGWQAFHDFIVGIWTTLVSAVTETFINPAQAALDSAWTYITGGASTAWDAFKNNITTPIGETWTVFTTFIGKAWDAFKTFHTDLAGKAKEIGNSIIQGIKEGITTKFEQMKNDFWNGARGVLDVIKLALGISSPSSVMKDEVGVPIVEGISAGIAAKQADLNTALVNLFGDVKAFEGLVASFNEKGRLLGQAFAAGIEGSVGDTFQWLVFSVQQSLSTIGIQTAIITSTMIGLWLDFTMSLTTLTDSLYYDITDSFGGISQAIMPIANLVSALEDIWSTAMVNMGQQMAALAYGVLESASSIRDSMNLVVMAVTRAIESLSSFQFAQIGAGIGTGLVGGAEDSLGIASPSKEFQRIGEQVVAGFNRGADGMVAEVGSVVPRYGGNGSALADVAATTAGGGVTWTGDVIVQGSIIAQQEVGRIVRDQLVRIGNRSGTAGVK